MIRNCLKLGLVVLAFSALSFPAMAASGCKTKCTNYLGSGGGKSASCCPYMKAAKAHCGVKTISKTSGLFESRGNK